MPLCVYGAGKNEADSEEMDMAAAEVVSRGKEVDGFPVGVYECKHISLTVLMGGGGRERLYVHRARKRRQQARKGDMAGRRWSCEESRWFGHFKRGSQWFVSRDEIICMDTKIKHV